MISFSGDMNILRFRSAIVNNRNQNIFAEIPAPSAAAGKR